MYILFIVFPPPTHVTIVHIQRNNIAAAKNIQNCLAFIPSDTPLLSLCSIILKFSKNEEDQKLIDVAPPNMIIPIIIEIIISVVPFIFLLLNNDIKTIIKITNKAMAVLIPFVQLISF